LSTENPSRIAIIDLARTASILAVMARHFSNPTITAAEPATFSTMLLKFVDAVGSHGQYGVTMFFVISGFVISRMISMRYGGLYAIDCRDFYIRRIARIWPLLITTVILGLSIAAFFASHPSASGPVIYQIFSPNPAVFDGLFFLSLVTITLNWLLIARSGQYGLHWAILWSICVEEQFYLFYPLVLRVLNSDRRLIRLLLLLVAVGPLARWIGAMNDPGGRAALENSFAAFDLLSMGILLFIAHHKTAENTTVKKFAPLICIVGFLLAVAAYFGTDPRDNLQVVYGPTLLGLGLSSFLFGGLAGPKFNWIPSAVAFPGKLSYGMYLYHPFCLVAAAGLVSVPNRLLLWATFVGVTIALSAASFNLYEQPMNRIISRKFSKGYK
jgi:peptidoglycan/LPS O-acetylase OafA/YrhL